MKLSNPTLFKNQINNFFTIFYVLDFQVFIHYYNYIIGFLASVLTIPLDNIKTRLQTQDCANEFD
jgi:hypothetical protein